MISYLQIQRIASKEGVPEEIIEKDYFIELILSFLAKEKYFREILIFRGGTALKKIYFPDYRFSEDLDFLIGGKEDFEKCEETLSRILEKISSEYPIQLSKRSECKKDRLQFFIVYDIVQEIRATKELKIDILKDDIIPAFQEKEILFRHEEFKGKGSKLPTYALESVVSDKISRILDVDNEPRDLYDLLYLLRLDIDIAKIKKELKRRFGYATYLPNLLTEIEKEVYKQNWELRLKHQIVDLPDYGTVIKELEGLIKIKLLK